VHAKSRFSRSALVAGPIVYLVLWLAVLPLLADTSPALALAALASASAGWCLVAAAIGGRNPVAWGAAGALLGLFELGVIPVVLVSWLGAGFRPAPD